MERDQMLYFVGAANWCLSNQLRKLKNEKKREMF